MNFGFYFLIFVSLIIGLIIFKIVKEQFKEYTILDNQIIIRYFGIFPKKLNANEIFEICISTIQGKNPSYHLTIFRKKIHIYTTKIKEEKFKSFAVRNNITLKHEEGFHGGYTEVLYQSTKNNIEN